ncbi:MAG: tRNA (adenosine(37)-N6)-threonylcarbamoyltransferase complex dimerization subunit type 1 TsaB [Pseudomonadota bacterium]|nr:tRNA (adenosine(37)-N6)-threonylcarbamoyltransferase complex dimerization subunit type 1 TsaB [Pseudomonadota bacterium]
MRQLVIDTATEALSVALFTDDTLTASHHEIAGRGHAEKLIPIIADLPEGGRADRVVVNRGPGSFTGVRVGIAAARALGYAWDAPVAAYSTLALLAAMARDENEGEEALHIAIHGGHGELFWQIFDRETLHPRQAVRSSPIMELAAMLEGRTVHGTGGPALIQAGCVCDAAISHPDARLLPLLPAQHLQIDLGPLYGRGADAVPLQPPRDQPCSRS